MKTHKVTGKEYCENRKEIAKRYFGSMADMMDDVYGKGNMGICTLLSDLQEQIAMGFSVEAKEYWREALNDIKCVLFTDYGQERYQKEYEELCKQYSTGRLTFEAFSIEVKKLKEEVV